MPIVPTADEARALADFDAHGVATFRPAGAAFLTAEQLASARAAFDAVPSVRAWAPPCPEEDDMAGGGRYRALTSDPAELPAALLEVVEHPLLEGLAKAALRAGAVHVIKASVVCSMPEPSDSTTSYTAHIDTQISARNWHATPRLGCTAALWVWISDTGPLTAPLTVSRGSHLALAAQQEATDPEAAAALPAGARGISTGADAELLRLSRELLPEPEPVLARAGDVTLVTTACLHRASPNRDTERRRLLIVTFGRVGGDAPRAENAVLRERLRPERRHLVLLPQSAAGQAAGSERRRAGWAQSRL